MTTVDVWSEVIEVMDKNVTMPPEWWHEHVDNGSGKLESEWSPRITAYLYRIDDLEVLSTSEDASGFMAIGTGFPWDAEDAPTTWAIHESEQGFLTSLQLRDEAEIKRFRDSIEVTNASAEEVESD